MGWNTNIDWRKANTHSALIPFFAEQNEVDTYITTYHSGLDLDLLRDFSPKSYIFNDFQCNKAEKTWVRDKHLRFKETLWLLNRSKIAYDYYVITRFDFDFRMNYFRNGKFDHEAINVTAQWCVGEDCSFVDDCFFIFHKSMLPSFTRLIESLPPDNGDIAYYHNLHKYPNSPKFSFLIDGSYWSHTCPALQVVRQ